MANEPKSQDETTSNPADTEDEVPIDDAVIGRAIRWSLVVIAALVLAALAVVYLRPAHLQPAAARDIHAPAVPKLAMDVTQIPPVRFVDVTRQAGINFVHNNGATGEKLLPETMGGGVAFLDYDSDGDADLLFVDSAEWPWSPRPRRRGGVVLYENDGSGRFRDVTAETGLEGDFYGMGVAAGDYDADGHVDLFVTAVGTNHLYWNEGGRFREVTQAAGVAGFAGEWSTSAAFFDYDNDGDLDLFVCNYVHWNREIDFDLNFTLNGTDRAYGPPTNFTGTYPYLYRNNGDGTFTDVSSESGIQVKNPATGKPMAKALALLPMDLDRDGLMDVIVANDTVQNQLFHNLGRGRFEEIGVEAGIAYDFDGNATGAMGIDGGFYRNDESLAIGIGNFANEMSSFYVSQDDPLWFMDVASSEGIGSPSRLKLSFGLFFFDYDLDGRLDLLQVNGHLEENIQEVQASQQYRQPAQLFWNSGNSSSPFVEVPAAAAGDLARPIVGRGAAYADIDGDGDLDVVLTQIAGPPLLLRNDAVLERHWLRVRLQDRGRNLDAIGAWVELSAGGIRQVRQVIPARSYLSQVELPVTFGLGDARIVDELKVTWPDGTTQQVEVTGVDKTLLVKRTG